MSQSVVEKFTYQSAMHLHRTLFLMDKQAERVLQDRHRMTLSQFFVLAQVVRGRQCQRDLAEAIGITPAAISRHISVLEAEGFLRRDPNGADKRFEYFSISAQGKREFEAAAADLDEFFEERYRSLKPSQKKEIMQALASLMGCYEGQC